MTLRTTWKTGLAALGTASMMGLVGAGSGHAAPTDKPAQTAPKPKKSGPTCTLLTTQAPRGGRLEVEGTGFGKSPLVRIADRVTRIIERTETTIAVQIHADSNGGEVTLQAGGERVSCGTLTIIGKDE